MKSEVKYLPLKFSVLSRVSRAIIVSAFFILHSAFLAAETPYYHHTPPKFEAVTFTNLPEIPTEYQLNEAADKLTDIVKGSIKTNSSETYAIERQMALPICRGSALVAWNAALAYNWTPSNYPGKIFDNVGWVRGTLNTVGGWSAYLWVLQNKITFQSSTSVWWTSTNDIPVAITNVFVGSLGTYGPVSNVVDIGPVIPSNFPGINQSDSGTYQVDITNVYYELIIPDIWITPRDAFALLGSTNPAQYTVTGTNIPQGVTWITIPDLSGSDGATIISNGAWQAVIMPGNIATNYKIRATSKDNTNFYDEVNLLVIKVDILESNVYVGVTNTTILHLIPDSIANVQWDITPEMEDGASIEGSAVGTSIVFNADSIITNYTVLATAVNLTNCYDTCTVTVVQIDIDTDSNNDGTIDADDAGEDQYEEYAPGRIICVNGYGINTNTDYLGEIKLALRPALTNGVLKLEAIEGGDRIKVWTTINKTAEITLPKTYDLSSTNSPSSFYVDGIVTGKVMVAWSYSYGNFACTDKVAMVIIPTISYTPVSSNAYVWSSLPSLGTGDGTEFQNQIKDEGFKVTWFSDSSASDTNFEDCSLANYKNMANAGAFTVISHGAVGKHLSVYAEDTTNGQNACNAWCGTEANMVTKREDGLGYYVEVSSKWLADNWKSGMDANRTIGMWSICYSASDNPSEGESSVKEATGGRWRSGYWNPTDETEARDVNKKFLERMNGTTDSTRKRTAGEAYEDGNGYTNNVKMDGNDWTTLCPAPLADNAVFPDTTAENRKGWGCIVFDTYMSEDNSANEALIKQSGCPTSNHRWFDNADGYYGLGFDFDKTGGATTTMRAVADKCRNKGGTEGRRMDGNRVTPSGDNRESSF